MISVLLVALGGAGLSPIDAWAKARPHHVHEDLFGEDDLQIGFLLGPQLTGFTAIQNGQAVVNVQSSMRFATGATFTFIYGLPRFEFDLMWNARGWVNTSDTLHSMSFPIIAKIPWEIDKDKFSDMDMEFGLGVQSDHPMFGADPHNQWLFGLLGSIGLSVDFIDWLFEFDLRYIIGFDNVSDQFNGGKPRDFQALAGVKWRF